MNTFRIAGGIAIVASATVLAVVACTDSKVPTGAGAPASPPTLTVAAGNAAALRAERATLRSRLPQRFAWVGEEHNRVMAIGIDEFQAAMRRDPAQGRRMRQGCDYTLALIEREMTPSVARAGLSKGETRRLFETVAPTARSEAVCRTQKRRPTQLALFVAPFAARSAGMPMLLEEGDAGFAVLDRLVASIDASVDEAAVNAALTGAMNEAAALTGLDQEIAYSGVSLAVSSAELWTSQGATGAPLYQGAPAAMAMFRRDQNSHDAKVLKIFLSADLAGCAVGAKYVQRVVKDWRPIAAGCFLTGVATSLSTFLI